ncbi:MAG: response regulator transcription factor [Chloroflexota bacterium]
MKKILIVDDNPKIRIMVSELLTEQGYATLNAKDGQEAIDLLQAEQPDLMLLDVKMPRVDGFAVIRRVRTFSDLPIIMLTSKKAEQDVIKGFDLGADDYITKPFRLRELLVRIRAVLRRGAPAGEEAEIVRIGDIQLNKKIGFFSLSGDEVQLTPIEFTLLRYLFDAAGQLKSRSNISIYLLESGFSGSEDSIKHHIRRLREKIEDDPKNPQYIETVYGLGYRFKSLN